MKLRYSPCDVCLTGYWAYEVVQKGTATGKTCAGLPVFSVKKTGEVYKDQKKAALRVAELNASGSSEFQYSRTVIDQYSRVPVIR